MFTQQCNETPPPIVNIIMNGMVNLVVHVQTVHTSCMALVVLAYGLTT